MTISTASLLLTNIILLSVLTALTVFFPILGIVLVWIYVIGLIVIVFFMSIGFWTFAKGRSDTKTALFLGMQLSAITGSVKSVRLVIASLLWILHMLILWPIEVMVLIWRYGHSSIVATDMQRQASHTTIYPLHFARALIVVLITALFFFFEAPLYTIVACGASAIVWLLTQTISPSNLLSELRSSEGSVVARLWLVAVAQIAILVLFFAKLSSFDNASLQPIELIRINLVELLQSPKDILEAISDTSISYLQLLKIGVGLLIYSTLIRLLIGKSEYRRTDTDWTKLANGQLLIGNPEKTLHLLQKVRNKGSKELDVRANGYLMLGMFDEALDTINVLHSVLGDKKEWPDQYAEAGMRLAIIHGENKLCNKYLIYWMEHGNPSDAMLASVILNFVNLLNQNPLYFSDLLPDGEYPLTQVLLHINYVSNEKINPDSEFIKDILNADYSDSHDHALCDLIGVYMLVEGAFESETSPTELLERITDKAKNFTAQQCIHFYDRILGLKMMVADMPDHSDMKGSVIKLKETLLGKLATEKAETVRSLEGYMGRHFQEKLGY